MDNSILNNKTGKKEMIIGHWVMRDETHLFIHSPTHPIYVILASDVKEEEQIRNYLEEPQLNVSHLQSPTKFEIGFLKKHSSSQVIFFLGGRGG
jgi:hypothetical protein